MFSLTCLKKRRRVSHHFEHRKAFWEAITWKENGNSSASQDSRHSLLTDRSRHFTCGNHRVRCSEYTKLARQPQNFRLFTSIKGRTATASIHKYRPSIFSPFHSAPPSTFDPQSKSSVNSTLHFYLDKASSTLIVKMPRYGSSGSSPTPMLPHSAMTPPPIIPAKRKQTEL